MIIIGAFVCRGLRGDVARSAPRHEAFDLGQCLGALGARVLGGSGRPGAAGAACPAGLCGQMTKEERQRVEEIRKEIKS